MDDNYNFIQLKMSDKREDKFILKHDHLDFDGESIEIEYKGDFQKDSVDLAVEKFLITGRLPSKNDLN